MSLFHLIVIIAPHVKSHSLQERNVQGNALVVDHHIKKSIYIYIYIFTRTVRKALCNITQKQSLCSELMSLRIEQNWKWSNKTFFHTLCVVLKLLTVAFV